MVWSPGTVSVEFRDVPILFWLGIQKSNTNLNNLFFMNIKFDEIFGEIDNV